MPMKYLFAAMALLILMNACSGGEPEGALVADVIDTESSVDEPVETVEVQDDSQVIIETPEREEAVFEDDTADRLAQQQVAIIEEIIESPPKLQPGDKTSIVEQMYENYQQLESYQFKTPLAAWFIHGDKARMLPFDPIRYTNFQEGNNFFREVFIDEVLFDLRGRTATGYCAGVDEGVNRQCAALELYEVPLTLRFGEHIIKLPHQYVEERLGEVPDREEHDKYTVQGLLTTKVTFQDGVEYFFYAKAGLPVRIASAPLKRVIFDSLVINQVRPEDVTHRSKDEIPSEEAFYQPTY